MRVRIGRKKITIRRDAIVGFLVGVLVVGIGYELYSYTRQQSKPVDSVRYDASGLGIRWLPPTVQRWEEDIERHARTYNVNPDIIAILMSIESGGYSRASSGVAYGLMQVTEYTGGDIAKKFLKEPVDEYDLYDPATNIEFGAAYIAYLMNTFCSERISSNECVELIAAGYNGGPGAANNLYEGNGLEDMETVGYSRDARNMWRERGAAKSPTYARWLERGGQSLIDAAKAE